VKIDYQLHDAFHAGDIYETGKAEEITLPNGESLEIKGGWYNQTVMAQLVRVEEAAGHQLSPEDIKDTVMGLRGMFGLEQVPIEPYRKP
jgi:hypothetical protein